MFKKAFITLFNLEQNEISIVFWLIFQSIFIGIFVGTYDVAAHSLFLEEFGEKAIPKAYVFSGILGIVTTFIYSQLQKFLKFSTLSLINLAYIAFATVSIRILFEIHTAEVAIYALFIFFGPLNILAILGFWGLANRIFSLRQGKRLFGIIDSGLIIGVILSSAAIPILPAIFGFVPDVKDLVSVSVLFISFALLIQFGILKVKVVKDANLSPIKKSKEKKKVSLVRNKYILFMSLFVGLSMVVAFFIVYIFLAVTEKQYESSADLALFLAQFTLAMMIVTLIVKTFVYNRLIKTYGLKATLLILPFLLILILVGINILSYTTDVSSIESDGFMLFFILVALARLFSNALKSGLEVPAFKLLYHSLDKEIKYDAQAKIDGVVNEISAVCSGLILAGLAIVFSESISFIYVLMVIMVLWVIVTFYLYKFYRESLASSKSEGVEKDKDNRIETLIAKKEIQLTPRNKAIINKINPFLLNKKKTIPEELKNKNLSYNHLSDKINSFDDVQIFEALDYIEYNKNKDFIPLLITLLKSPKDAVKFRAIEVSLFYDVPSVNTLLIDFIKNPKFKQLICSVLLKRKSDLIPQIKYHFDSSSATFEYQADLIEMVAQIQSEAGIEFLRELYERTNPKLVDLAISKLSDIGYQEFERKETLVRIVKERLEIAAWNLVVLLNLSKEQHKELRFIFKKQIANDRIVIFSALRLIYEKSMLKKAQENFELNTLEGTEMSLELMDMLLDDSIKPIVNSYFEIYGAKEKINKLADHFPVEHIKESNVIDMISIRDIRFLNEHIIAFAILNHFGSLSKVALLQAHFYNPTYSIRESVHFVMKNYFTDYYDELVKRMNDEEMKKYYINLPEKISSLVSHKFSKLIEMQSLKELNFTHFGELSKHITDSETKEADLYFDYENDQILYSDKIDPNKKNYYFAIDKKNMIELAGNNTFLRFLLTNNSALS